ncbi:MAG TPA: hypothetical protein VN699_06395 [Pirellulales bacterium]|nr:hypothetical protein [Pirellulales bacterium]
MPFDGNPTRRPSVVAAFIAAVASFVGCSKSEPPDAAPGRVSQGVKVTGFDADGEPVIQTLEDGSIRIVFEAMPPFFAEDNGTEADFEKFEDVMSKRIGLPVTREDREVFVIHNAPAGTAEQLKEWLERFHQGPS